MAIYIPSIITNTNFMSLSAIESTRGTQYSLVNKSE